MKRSAKSKALSLARFVAANPEPALSVVYRRKPKKADGGSADKPPFDPSKPFKDASDPNGPWQDYQTTSSKIVDPSDNEGPWSEYQKPPFDPSKPYTAGPPPFEATQPISPDEGMLHALGHGALQGATFNFGDELAGVRAAGSDSTPDLVMAGPLPIPARTAQGAYRLAKNWLVGGEPEAEAAYEKARDAERQAVQSAQEHHPYAYGAGEVAGSIPSMAAMPEVGAIKGTGLAANIGRGAVAGAEYGALSGLGEGTDATSRLEGAGKGVLGGSVAGVGGALAGEAAIAGARGAGWLLKGAKDYLAPLTESGQQRAAAKTLAKRATNPTALRYALENPPADLVSGSKPTTFQQTGDMGLGSLEREVAAQNPAEFMQRRADQNAARVDALGELQRTGSPADVSNAVRQQLQSIDQMTADAVARATEAAAGHTEALGGLGTSEGYGAALRDYAAQARATAKEQERSLWKAVDPDNTLALPVSPLKDAATGLEKSVTGSARPIAGEERAVLDTIDQYHSVMPFSEVTDLRSRVSTAMREELRERGETPVYARLSRLRGAIENTIAGAVEHQSAQEASAVARGELAPEQTAAARIRDWQDAWYSRQAEARANDAASAGGNAGGRSAAVPGPRGAAGQARERLGNSAGDQGLSPNGGLAPNFDQAARGRLNTATAATRDRVQTFDNGPVGAVLRPGGMKGQYRAADSTVPAQIFKRGPGGFEATNSYRNAVGDQQAMGVLGDYAAASLRQAAAKSDGTLDPARFVAWRKAHADALRALPELAGRFEDAAGASRAIEDVAAIRREALEHYQRGAFGQLANANSPEDVTRIIGSLFGQKDSAKTMRSLVGETRNNSAAREGLRKAVVDHIMGKFISNTEAGSSELGTIKSDQFQNFVRNNSPVLRQIFSEPEINSMRAIANDLQRSNRSITAVKLPGGSNTAQDQAAKQLSLLSKIIHHGRDTAAGAALGMGAAGPFGALLGTVGGSVVTAMRDAGMKRIDDLVRDALLNPELARKLLAKGPESGSKIRQINLAQYLRRNSAAALFGTKTDNTEEKQ